MIMTSASVGLVLMVMVVGVIQCFRARQELGWRHALHGAIYHTCATALLAVLVLALIFPSTRLIESLCRSLHAMPVRKPAARWGSQADRSSGLPADMRLSPELRLGAGKTILSNDDGLPRVALILSDAFVKEDFPVYMRQFHVSYFHEQNWIGHSDRRILHADPSDGWVRLAAGNTGKDAMVAALRGAIGPLPLPIRTLALSAGNVIHGNGVWVSHEPTEQGVRVRVRWASTQVLMDLKASTLIPGVGYEDLLEEPGGAVGNAIDGLVAEARLAQPDAQLASLLVALRQRCHYSSIAPDDAGAIHPLVAFLERDFSGDCEMFASAFALGGRKLGFPSRVCAGYCGGELDVTGKVLTFFQRDRHAWVELLTVDGWVAVDPTPSDDEAWQTLPRQKERPSQIDIAKLVPALGDDGTSLRVLSREPIRPEESSASRAGMHPLPLLALILIILVLTLGRLRLLRRERSRHATESVPTFDPRLVAELNAYFRRFGNPWPNTRTLREHVEWLRETKPISETLSAAVSYVYGTCFEGAGRDTIREKRLRQALRRERRAMK